jgi:serine/threonine protein kinase
MIEALLFLSKQFKIAHRDVKPENILIVKNTFKLCDLDNCHRYNNKTLEKELFLGTIEFQSPVIKIYLSKGNFQSILIKERKIKLQLL